MGSRSNFSAAPGQRLAVVDRNLEDGQARLVFRGTLVVDRHHRGVLLEGASAGAARQAAPAGDGPLLAVACQRYALGAGPDVPLVGLAGPRQDDPLWKAVDLVRHPADHIVGLPVGASYRLGDMVDGDPVGRTAQELPECQHPAPHSDMPVVQDGVRLVVERPAAILAEVAPEAFPA